jgi:hypothetical protein
MRIKFPENLLKKTKTTLTCAKFDDYTRQVIVTNEDPEFEWILLPLDTSNDSHNSINMHHSPSTYQSLYVSL